MAMGEFAENGVVNVGAVLITRHNALDAMAGEHVLEEIHFHDELRSQQSDL